MSKEEAVNYWVKSSELDLETAEDLFKTKHYHYCLFFCHLFVEKIIKALIVKNTGENPLPIHKLRLLAKDTGIKFSEEQLKLLDKITGFNIKARYNDVKFRFYKMATKEFTKEYFEKSKGIYQWLKKQI